jgi:hypothetical protein
VWSAQSLGAGLSRSLACQTTAGGNHAYAHYVTPHPYRQNSRQQQAKGHAGKYAASSSTCSCNIAISQAGQLLPAFAAASLLQDPSTQSVLALGGILEPMCQAGLHNRAVKASTQQAAGLHDYQTTRHPNWSDTRQPDYQTPCQRMRTQPRPCAVAHHHSHRRAEAAANSALSCLAGWGHSTGVYHQGVTLTPRVWAAGTVELFGA